jgi:hypothetical protein
VSSFGGKYPFNSQGKCTLPDTMVIPIHPELTLKSDVPDFLLNQIFGTDFGNVERQEKGSLHMPCPTSTIAFG